MQEGCVLGAAIKVENMDKIASLGELRVWGKHTLRSPAGSLSLLVSNALSLVEEEIVARSPELISQR